MITEDLSLDRVSVGITIESTILTPEQISQRIGIVWDEVHRIGDPRGHTGKKWECNVWRIFERRQGVVNASAHDLLPVCVADVVNRLARSPNACARSAMPKAGSSLFGSAQESDNLPEKPAFSERWPLASLRG